MKHFFDYIKGFAFKNLFAIFLAWQLLRLLEIKPDLRDIIVILLTLIVKHFYDSNTTSVKKDETISKALDQAQQLPAVNSPAATTESGNVTVNQTKETKK